MNQMKNQKPNIDYILDFLFPANLVQLRHQIVHLVHYQKFRRFSQRSLRYRGVTLTTALAITLVTAGLLAGGRIDGGAAIDQPAGAAPADQTREQRRLDDGGEVE